MSPEIIVQSNQPKLPSLFVPHGAPTFALRPGAAGAAMARAAAALPRPRAVVIVSAHWDTDVATVGAARRPATIHDYRGFQPELYAIEYPATGCQEASAEVMDHIGGAGIPVALDEARGLDHGAWIPLRLMFPDADVPVIPLSIQGRIGPRHHLALGRALAPLAARGFLVVGSGNLTHNLGDYQRAVRGSGASPAYVREFADWIWSRLEARDESALLDYRRLAPQGERAHPSEDHLLPFFVALGAGGMGAGVERLHAGVDDYVLAMDAYAFRGAQQ
jgi:4,5-DOPA dioxygenase extradiol